MISNRVASISLALCLALSGCLQGTDGTETRPVAQAGGGVVERDVEAPDVFSQSDKGLLDGRPSLGGVWVAHPDVKAPERVIIRNTDSGRETVGALFKRERMNPGPVFQVSAEAAEAVGMLPGAPTPLEVVALRTEEQRPAPEAAPDATAEPASETASAPPAEADSETAAQATAESAPDGTAEADAASETMIALPDAEEPRKRGFFARLFGRDDAEPSEITTATLDAAPSATDAPAVAADAVPTMPTPMAGASTDTPAPSALDRPFVQIGIFSVESNADGATETMRKAGLTASIKPGRTQGNAFWRVVVGPASTAAERRDILAQVKKLGFADAYAVRR